MTEHNLATAGSSGEPDLTGLVAIETHYRGYRFRSRTEARWAVFFDALGLKWEYEKEGYNLDGHRYLPDFWLPDLGGWFEVKGRDPTEHELNLLGRLVHKSRQGAFMAVGAPQENEHQLIYFTVPLADRWYNKRDEAATAYVGLNAGPGYPAKFRFDLTAEAELGMWLHGFTGSGFALRWKPSDRSLRKAYDAATGARFEHGEEGANKAGNYGAYEPIRRRKAIL